MSEEMKSYLRRLSAYQKDPLNNPRPRLPSVVREAMANLGAKGGAAGRGASKRRSPEHYLKMALARRKK